MLKKSSTSSLWLCRTVFLCVKKNCQRLVCGFATLDFYLLKKWQCPILFPVFGAVLSGCVAGDHISPISETTVMSSISSRTPIMDHVQTQMPYGLILIFGTGISFLSTTYLMKAIGTIPGMCTSLLSGILISIILFKVFDRQHHNTQEKT